MSDTATLVLSAVSAIGGLAGFLALALEVQDRKARKRVAHLPPELRPVLIEIVDVAQQVADSPRDSAWTTAHVDPVAKRFTPLREVSMSPHNKDWLALATLDQSLAAMSVYAYSDTGDPSGTALHPAKQHDAAQKCVEVASALLLKLGSASV